MRAKMLSTVYLSLGSNIGDRLSHLSGGVQAMAVLGSLGAVSAVYETEPWGYQDPHAYLNMVLELRTSIAPETLYARILEAEISRGRMLKTLSNTYAARELDIDILFFGNKIISTPSLTVPHPRIELRKFVLIPMAEVNSLHVHPLSGKTVKALLEETPDKSQISHYADGV